MKVWILWWTYPSRASRKWSTKTRKFFFFSLHLLSFILFFLNSFTLRKEFLLQFAHIFPRRERVRETHTTHLQLASQRTAILQSQIRFVVKWLLANSECEPSESVSSGLGFQVLFESESEPKLDELAQRVHQTGARKAQQKWVELLIFLF